jgi:Subtilase family/PA domain/Fibronectin type-III domain
LAGLRKEHRTLARKLPFILAIATLGALIAASSSASSGAKLRAMPLGSNSIVSIDTVAKSASGRLARTSSALLGLKSARPVNVMIKYDFDPTASYRGGVAGLRATSPRATGVKLALNKAAVRAYGRFTARYVRSVNRAIHAKVGGVQIRQVYRTAYGGVAAQVPGNSISKLLKVRGVVAVQKDTLQQPLDDNTTFIGATAVWPSLGGSAHAGNNVVIGVLDTGIWPEHPMMSAVGVPAPAGGLKGCQFGNGSDTAHLGQPFACNNKLIGAYSKMATYMSAHGADANEFCNNTTHVCSPRDSEGHGTHTTTTAGGDCVTTAVLYGVERGPVCGIAPGAHIEMFRVCGSAGCFTSDSVSAVSQAIADGVNVINFSISGGGQPYTDPVELAFLDATNAGISVNASAGNSGPGAGTSDHGGPWTTTVGASTGPRSFTSTLHLTADAGATLDVAGVTLTDGISNPTPVVLAATLPKAGGGNEDALCQSDVAAGAATGKVVVCRRGGNGRIDKGRRVLAGGAAGMILYNQSAAVTDLESDNHYLPAIQTQFNSNSIATFVMGHTNVMATWAQGTASPAQADVMASFSSRGPTGDWIKPDITAPGVQVLAGMTPQPDQTTADNGPPGNLYQAIAGTSMSSPHAAGVSALVKAAHPTWTPEEIKSALMTSSVQSVVKEDGTTPATPFDDGAGSIRADRAVNPTLVFNETYADFVAAGTDALHRIDLNLASIDATTMSGQISTKRTAINVSGQNQVLKVSIVAPAGATITVGNNNGNISVKAGDSVTFPITISAPTLATGQYFGRITLDPQKAGATPVTLPVAFVKKQGAVTLTHSCTPASFGVAGSSHCTVSASNLASVEANASVKVSGSPGLHYSNVSAPASLVAPHFGAQWSGTLSPALPPTVDSITNITGNGPAGGYLPLTFFPGNLLIPGGDDTINNVNVPTFYYGGEAYSRIGVVSNGYVVLGGGTASDVNFFPQTFPNPARPNNVIAPFWTDLNTTGGTAGNNAIQVNVLGDGDSDWIVIDFESVKNFSNSTTHTGEIWIRASLLNHTGPAGEQLTVSYGTANAAAGDPGSAINWGAENRDGTSGKNLPSAPANDTEYRINTSPPTPGGHVTFTYDASADTSGTYDSTASMTSNVTPGITQVLQTLTVTP